MGTEGRQRRTDDEEGRTDKGDDGRTDRFSLANIVLDLTRKKGFVEFYALTSVCRRHQICIHRVLVTYESLHVGVFNVLKSIPNLTSFSYDLIVREGETILLCLFYQK